MKTLNAQVKGGRIVVDDLTTLPEGTKLTLCVLDGDELDDQERAALHASLRRARAHVEAGNTQPVEELLDALDALP